MGFCVCGADDWSEDWQRWDDHPARRQWEVVKDLGAGAMSQVVLGRHVETGKMAALKVVFLQSPAILDDPEHLAILQRESDLLSMLEHPHLVELKDVIRSPKQLVLVLEWLRGGQVIDRLHELGLQYSEQQAAAIFVQVAEAVAHMHEYNVLHRDIKPENVMFAEPPAEMQQAPLTAAQLQSGRPLVPRQSMPTVKLVDLGMACLFNPDKPVTGPLGSPGFVAPEIIHNGVHTAAMDVFSTGVLLFIMLVGRKPFNIKESESLRYAMMSLTEAPGLKDPRWLDLSPDAKHLVMGMLAYDPARRLTMPQARRRGPGGVVAFNRAAAAAGASQHTPAQAAASSKEAYLRRLKQSQRLDPSSRRGNAMNRMAASLASSAYAKAHDAGGSIHPRDDVSVRPGAQHAPAGSSADGSLAGRRGSWRRSNPSLRGGSLHGVGQGQDASTSRRLRFASLMPGGLTKSPTTIMLSEMDRGSSRELSRRGGAAGQPPPGWQAAPLLARRPSTLQLLSAAAKVYLEGSTHGSRRGGGMAAAAVAASPSLAGASSGSALRQVADESSAKQRRGLQGGHHSGTLPAVADCSHSSSASSSLGRGADSEARRRGAAAAAATPQQHQQPGDAAPLPLAGAVSAPPAVLAARPASSSSREGSGTIRDGSGAASRDGSGVLLAGLRPHRVVQRRSLDNPLAPGAAAVPNRTWAEMQSVLRQQTPRSSRSREGTAGGTPSTRVLRLKPLE